MLCYVMLCYVSYINGLMKTKVDFVIRMSMSHTLLIMVVFHFCFSMSLY